MKRTLLFCALLLSSGLSTRAQSDAAAKPAGDGLFLDVGGAKLWYEECGTKSAASPAGANVVLLHDGLIHSITWDGVWAPLCAKYRVVRYDRRGYGRSDAATASFAATDDLYRVMKQVHMERAFVVGNSSGGALALDFALAHPDMVEGLFLIGPVVHGMATSDCFTERGAKNNAPLGKDDVKGTAENWSRDRFLVGGDDARSRKAVYNALSQNPRNLRITGEFEIQPTPPSVLRLSEIRVPVVILAGEADIADVFANSGAIEAAVPLASLEVWKDVGHLIQIQRPAELVGRFNRFVTLTERKEVPLNEAQLSALAGEYTITRVVAKVFIHENRLTLEFPGSPYYRLYAASETRFFLRNDDAEVEFLRDVAGKVTAMVIHNSDGSTISCPRIHNEKPQ